MNDKSFPSSKAPTSKSENAWPGSVKFQKNGEHSFSKNLHQDSDSTRHSAVREAKFAEFENETIQKQRQEMQLLIAELRSRDRELNDMVTGHRKQLMAWEQDRTRITALEEKCSRYERELHGRNEEIYGLTAKLRVIDSEEESRQMALRNMQDQLNSVTEQHCLTSQRLNEAQEVNRGLGRTIKELKSAAGQHEQREQELFQLLSSKDRDLSEAASHIAEISAKLKRCEFQVQESHQGSADLKRQVSEWRNRHAELGRELDYAKKQNAKLEELSAKQRSDAQQQRQQLITTRSEVTMSNEREQRKDELLQLQKSKQDRTDAELAALRELCEIQQRDLSLLQSSLDTAKNLLNCRQKSLNQDRSCVNYSHSQMLLPSQPSQSSPSFCDSPVRSYLRKSSSPAAWKDTDAADSNINNHANLMLSRYSALRAASESPKVTNWSNQNPSIPFSLERKTYDWQGGRLVEDHSEKQSTVELDESPTKDVMSSDLEKSSATRAADRTLKTNTVENRVESSIGSSSNRFGRGSLAQSHGISPWEGQGASTRTLGVPSPHGSWLNQKPRLVSSSDKMSAGSSVIVEESDEDVVRDEVSTEGHASVDEESVAGDGITVGLRIKVEEGKVGGRDHWKREVYVENEGSRSNMNSTTHVVTPLSSEKLLGMSLVAKGEISSRDGSAENGRMLVREGDSVKSGQGIVGNQDSSENSAIRLSSAMDDDDGSMHPNICASNLFPSNLSSPDLSSKGEGGFKTGYYCPSKFSSRQDEGGSQSGNYFPSKMSFTKDEGLSQSGNYSSSMLSSTKEVGGSELENYSRLSSSKAESGFQSENYCPSKSSSSKDEGGSVSLNYCTSNLSSNKNKGSFLSGNYCSSKLSSTRDEGGSQSDSYCPSRSSSTKNQSGFPSGKFSSSKDGDGSQLEYYCPSRASSTKDGVGSQSELHCPSRLSSSYEDDGRSRSATPKPYAVVDDKISVRTQSLSKDDNDSQLPCNSVSPPSKSPSLESDSMSKCDGDPKLENGLHPEISILTSDDGPDLEKAGPSRVSSLSSVSQYSFQSLPANYGSLRKSGDGKFPIPSLRSGHWSGSCEKLSEAVGKDWARSCTWNSMTGEPTDSAFRQMSSFIGGVGGRGGAQRDVKVDSKEKSDSNESDGRSASRQDFGKDTFLQEEENVIEIHIPSRYSAQTSGTISESSSHLDVFSDALA